MEPVNFGIWVLRQLLDVVNIPIKVGELRREVDARGRELVVVVLVDFFAVEGLEDDFHQSSVLVVCDSSSVVTLSSQVVQGVKRNLLWVFVDEDDQLTSTDSEVRLVELILNVPSKRSKQSSLLDECMEETETEQELAEYLGMTTRFKPCLVTDWVGCVRTKQVCLQAHWRLIRHLNTILQDCNWEGV